MTNKIPNTKNRNNTIIIFGFSGSGKSTIANLISKKYGLRIIHPSGIMRDLYEKKQIDIQHTRYNKGFWESKKGIKILKNRLNEKKPVDVIADKIILKEIKKGNVVIDSWNLPWLTNIGTKIYLRAKLDMRAKRVAKRSKISFTKARAIITKKDNDTYKLFKRVYEIDIKHDRNVFDYEINTNNLTKKEVFKSLCEYLDKNTDKISLNCAKNRLKVSI